MKSWFEAVSSEADGYSYAAYCKLNVLRFVARGELGFPYEQVPLSCMLVVEVCEPEDQSNE